MVEIKSTNKYTIYRKYKTIGGGTPIPMDEYKAVLYEENSPDCGYIAPQYRWDVVAGEFLCDDETYTKYEMKIKMVSFDSGLTWSAVVPTETERGDVIAYESYDCGMPMYRWVSTGDFTCVDNEDDWKVKVTYSGGTEYIVPCNESSTLVTSECSGISSSLRATSVDIGDCVNDVNCTITQITSSPTLHLGEYVEKIGTGNARLLYTCSIAEDTFNDNLRIIRNGAFQDKASFNNELIHLGSKIESLGSYSFKRGYNQSELNLRTVIIDALIPPTVTSDSFTIGGTYGVNAFFVPSGSVDTYRTAWGSSYSNYIFSQAEEDTFFRALYSGGAHGWNFSEEGTNGVLTKEMVHASYKGRTISSMTLADMSDNITEIGASAFTPYFSTYASGAAISLLSVQLPKNLVTIGNSAFGGNLSGSSDGCSALTTVDTSRCERLATIGAGAFNGCVNLTGITIPNTVTRINQSTFKNCRSMTYCNMSSALTSIGTSAFEGCYSLSAITIPSGVTRLGGESGADGNTAFYNCSGLTSVTLSSGLTSIGYSTFRNCSGLTSINIPSTVDYIGNYSFVNCTSLSSVTIGSGDTYISGRAFEGCKGITDLNIGNFTTIDEYAFTGCKNINVIDLNCRENGIIKKYAFEGCSGATRINIGSGVTKIEDMAFYNTVYHYADDDNYRPSENTIVVYCYATTPPQIGFGSADSGNRPSPFVYKGMHYVYYYKPVVYVPCSVLDVYTASKWNNICVLKAMDDSCAEIS